MPKIINLDFCQAKRKNDMNGKLLSDSKKMIDRLYLIMQV